METNELTTNNVNIAIDMLKDILEWSDRIGSDEIYHIEEIIKVLKSKIKIIDVNELTK